MSYQNVIDWVSDELGSAITIESGQYGQSDLDRVRNLIPPGYFDEFDFPELSMEIMPTNRYQAHELYLNATKKFSGEPFLSEEGDLKNYTAGMPFSREQILEESIQSSGLMVAYNQIHRWQNFGYKVDNLTFNVEPSPNGKKGNLVESVMLGGGHVDRDFTMFYHRVYLSKLASKPNNGYALDVDGSDELLFKEYVGFSAPFDMAGTVSYTHLTLPTKA